jgi:hypothetical protein
LEFEKEPLARNLRGVNAKELEQKITTKAED